MATSVGQMQYCSSTQPVAKAAEKEIVFHPHHFCYVKAKRSLTVILLPNWSEIIYFMLKIDINSIREKKRNKYESIQFI